MTAESLSARLSRREIALSVALDKVAVLADDQPPLFWFTHVFREWMRPQSHCRRFIIRAAFSGAIDAIDSLDDPQDYCI